MKGVSLSKLTHSLIFYNFPPFYTYSMNRGYNLFVFLSKMSVALSLLYHLYLCKANKVN